MTDTQQNGFDLEAAPNVADREDRGTTIHVRDESDEPMYYFDGDQKKPVTITVAGSYSNIARRAQAAARKRMFKHRRAEAPDLIEQSIEIAAACTIMWDGFFVRGQRVECSPENAKKVYQRAPWIRDQVVAAMDDHAAFFENGSPS